MTVKGWDLVSAWLTGVLNRDDAFITDPWRERVAWYFGLWEYDSSLPSVAGPNSKRIREQ